MTPQSEIRNPKSEIVIVYPSANRQIIFAVSDSAAARGIRPGMTLAQARALCAAVEHVDYDPRRDTAALQALARWMLRFSPMVSIAENDELLNQKSKIQNQKTLSLQLGKFGGKREIARDAPPTAGDWPAIYIDLTGTQRLHGDPRRVAEQIAAKLRQWNISAAVAIGETVGAAWAKTYCQSPIAGRGMESSSNQSSAIDHRQSDALPIAALRLPADTIAALHHLGIRTIGQLRRLPRDELPSRFTPLILLRLDQAMGKVDEIIEPIRPLSPIAAGQRWEQPVDSLEWLWPIARKLIEQICRQLSRYGRGARELHATLRLALGDPVQRTVRFSRPTRDPLRMFELLREALSNSQLPMANCRMKSAIKNRQPEISPDLSDIDYEGFTAVHLQVTRHELVPAEQITLLGADEFASRLELDDLIERLRVRMAPAAVSQARPVESYIPERAFVLEEQAAEETERPRDQETRCTDCGSSTSSLRLFVSPSLSSPSSLPLSVSSSLSSSPSFSSPSSLRRSVAPSLPIRLFPPRELRVVVSPSHDRDGRPVQITMRDGQVLAVVHSIGPRRVSGEWWIGHDKSRDYFDAEIEGGRRWFIFRVNETGRWFWQGEF